MIDCVKSAVKLDEGECNFLRLWESAIFLLTYIHKAAILRRKLARLLRGGIIPGGPGSDNGSWRRRNVSAKCSARWLDSSRASPVKSSSVTRSTTHSKNKKWKIRFFNMFKCIIYGNNRKDSCRPDMETRWRRSRAASHVYGRNTSSVRKRWVPLLRAWWIFHRWVDGRLRRQYVRERPIGAGTRQGRMCRKYPCLW